MNEIIKFMVESLGLDGGHISGPADYGKPIFSAGAIDSFGVLQLIAFLEQRFGVEIDVNSHEIADFDTVNKISALLKNMGIKNI